MNLVGERIRIIRKSLGITQRELGLRLGIKQQMISLYEIGRSPKIETIKKNSRCFRSGCHATN